MKNRVIAQVKLADSMPLVQFATDEPLYDDDTSQEYPNTSIIEPFSTKGWSEIRNVSREIFFPDFLKKEAFMQPHPEITAEQFPLIKWIAEIHGDCAYFQRVTASVYEPTTFLDCTNSVSFKKRYKLLKVHPTPEFLYSFSTDSLHYNDFGALECVFSGIHTQISEDEDEMTGNFLESSLFFNLNKLSRKDFSFENQKRMTYLNHVTHDLSAKQRAILVDYLVEVDSRLITTPSGTEIVVRDDADLTRLVSALDDAVYRPNGCSLTSLNIWKRRHLFLR
jgi:hypothetical protein